MSYNGQRYVELFSLTNKDILKAWKVLSGVKKVFDDKLKSFVCCLRGKAPVPLMQWPKDKSNIVLSHPILVFQMHISAEANILFDIRISCHNNLRKRITLSTNQKTVCKTLLSVILPVTVKKRGTWSHLLVDIEDIVSSVWQRDSFKTIDSISLSGTCSIKRIFTLRREMVHIGEGVQSIKFDQIPKQLLLSRTSSPTYDFILCLNSSEAEEEKSSTPSFTDGFFSTPSSSKSSLRGHFNIMKRSSSISISSKSPGSTTQSASNKSEYNFYDEDTKSKCSTAEDRVDTDHVLPLLSRLTFTDALTEYSSEL